MEIDIFVIVTVEQVVEAFHVQGQVVATRKSDHFLKQVRVPEGDVGRLVGAEATAMSDASHDLVREVKAAAQANMRNVRVRSPMPQQPVAAKLSSDAVLAAAPQATRHKTTEQIVAMGTSTGGTQALEKASVAWADDWKRNIHGRAELRRHETSANASCADWGNTGETPTLLISARSKLARCWASPCSAQPTRAELA